MRVEVAYDKAEGEWAAIPKRMRDTISFHETKAMAEKVAKTLARKNECTCEIYSKDGRFQREYDYRTVKQAAGSSWGVFDPDDVDIPGL